MHYFAKLCVMVTTKILSWKNQVLSFGGQDCAVKECSVFNANPLVSSCISSEGSHCFRRKSDDKFFVELDVMG